MELTDKKIHLLARLSRDRGLYAECKGADLDGLQELGLLEWFDTRSSTAPFAQASTAESAWYQWQDRLCLHWTCRKLARACRAGSFCSG